MLHLVHGAENALESRLETIGLSLTKLVALTALFEAAAPMPLGRLAERLACVKSNITQLVDRLEADGFVARNADSKDRRARLATLTATGRRVCEEGLRIQREIERGLTARLTAGEAKQLAALLEKVSAAPG
jgi:DNA-binding MarR family transcriptional regulator